MRLITFLICTYFANAVCAQANDGSGVGHLEGMDLSQLLRHHVEIADELRRRGVVRSGNAPTGDLAEYLFVTAFDWQMSGRSQKGYDATDGLLRYQIKARRDYGQSGARQLSSIRDLDGFDFLAVLIFDRWYNVETAAIVPVQIVAERSSYVDYTASYRFVFNDEILQEPGVMNVTDLIVSQSGY